MAGPRVPLPRDHWRLIAASGISNIGDGVLLAALPLLAASATDRPLSVGLVSAAFTLPWLLLGLPVGAMVDRVDRRRAMVITDLVRGALVGALALAVALTDVEPWMLWVLAAGLGIGEVVFDSVSQAVVPMVVDEEQLDRANGWRNTAELVGNTFVGVPLGGLLFALAVWLPFGIDAASFIVAALLVARIGRGRNGLRPPDHEQPQRINLAEGLRWLRDHTVLRNLAVAIALINIAFAATESTFVLYLTRDVGLDVRLFGVVLAAMGCAAAGTGLATARIVDTIGRRATLIAAVITLVPVTAGLGLVQHLGIAIALVIVQPALLTVLGVVTITMRQQLIPAALFGRVNGAFRWLSWGMMPLGAVVGSALADRYGLRIPYGLSAVLLAAAATIVVLRLGEPRD